MRNLILLIISLAFLSSCSKHHTQPTFLETPQEFFNKLSDELSDREILVLDSNGSPVADAQITIGDQKNIVQTNNLGKFLIPNFWKSEDFIIVSKSGFVTTTFLNQLPEKNIYQINIATPEVQNEVTGITTGYPNLSNDGWADVSIIIPTMSQADTMSFELSKFISPELDEMSVVGFKTSVPSNTSIPTQEEKYNWLINLTLEKPNYRVYFDSLGKKQLATVHVRFEVKPAIKKLKGNASFLDMLNDFVFESAEITDVNLTSPKVQKNLGMNALPLNSSAQFKAPDYNPQYVYLAAGLIQNNNRYTPTDLKFFNPNEKLNLRFPANEQKRFSLSYLGEKQTVGDVVTLSPRMSLVFSDLSSTTNKAPLDLIAAPKIEGQAVFLTPPSAKSNMSNLGTSLVLYKVKKILTPNAYYEQKRILAEVYAPNWVKQLNVPQSIDKTITETGTRYEVSFFGTENQKSDLPIGLPQISTATHTTRNATDL